MSQHSGQLGTKPILGLFFGMAAPIAVGMMVHGLYNVVDAIFVTRVMGVNAMGGISIVFPIQMFIFALATLVGSGMASIVARQLGAKQENAANTTIDMAFRFGLVMALALTLGIYFNIDTEQWPTTATRVRCVYRLDINQFRGRESLQLLVQYMQPI